MNRRTFLRVSGAAALAIPLLGALPAVALADEDDDPEDDGLTREQRKQRVCLRKMTRKIAQAQP